MLAEIGLLATILAFVAGLVVGGAALFLLSNMARGITGQTIYVDPTAEMVLVRFSSYPQPKNALIDPTSLPAYQAVADYLLTRSR